MPPLAFLNAVPLTFTNPTVITAQSQRCKTTAVYLPPNAFSVDFTTAYSKGNFGAVFMGQYSDTDDPSGSFTNVVVKCPVEATLARKLYEMERHTNLKLQKKPSSIRRFPSYMGELIVPPETPVMSGLTRFGLVWQYSGAAESLEQYFIPSRLPQLAQILQTSAIATPLRRQLAATLIRELSYIVQELQSSGIVHRDIKPDNLLVVKNEPDAAPLQVIDFGSSCDWNTVFKKGLRLATCDPIYTAPERRLDILKPAFRFDVYSIALIALRAALPSLTTAAEMNLFVTNVLAKGRYSIARTCASVRGGRIQAPQALKTDLAILEGTGNEDLYAMLVTMLTETPDERATVSDCLRSRFIQTGGM